MYKAINRANQNAVIMPFGLTFLVTKSDTPELLYSRHKYQKIFGKRKKKSLPTVPILKSEVT
jgi:hypothetical protein